MSGTLNLGGLGLRERCLSDRKRQLSGMSYRSTIGGAEGPRHGGHRPQSHIRGCAEAGLELELEITCWVLTE